MEQEQDPQAPPPEAGAGDDTLRAELETARSATAEARAAQAAAVGALRENYRAANPGIASMIDGSTPEELAASLAKGQAFRDEVLAAEKAASSNGHAVAPVVPSGASAAPSVDYSAMSAMEKIRAGIAGRGN